jgi:hypothetical protein
MCPVNADLNHFKVSPIELTQWPLCYGFTNYFEFTILSHFSEMCKTQKVECFRLSFFTHYALLLCEATKSDKLSFLWM